MLVLNVKEPKKHVATSADFKLCQEVELNTITPNKTAILRFHDYYNSWTHKYLPQSERGYFNAIVGCHSPVA